MLAGQHSAFFHRLVRVKSVSVGRRNAVTVTVLRRRGTEAQARIVTRQLRKSRFSGQERGRFGKVISYPVPRLTDPAEIS